MEVSQRQTRAIQQEIDRANKEMESFREQEILRRNRLITEMQSKHKEELDSLHAQMQKDSATMRDGYRLEISRKAKLYDEELRKLDQEFAKMMDAKEKEHKEAFSRIEKREQTRIENYRKSQDEVIKKMHDKYMAAQEDFEKRLG